MLFLGFWRNLGDNALNSLRTLFAHLCQFIYPLICLAYELFLKLATFELFDSNGVTNIYKRVTMVLTIIMVFYIIFEFVKYFI